MSSENQKASTIITKKNNGKNEQVFGSILVIPDHHRFAHGFVFIGNRRMGEIKIYGDDSVDTGRCLDHAACFEVKIGKEPEGSEEKEKE